MDGQIKFYDEPTSWGVVLGDDGALYVVRGVRISGPPLQVGDRVAFEPRPAPGGPRATAVRRIAPADAPWNMAG